MSDSGNIFGMGVLVGIVLASLVSVIFFCGPIVDHEGRIEKLQAEMKLAKSRNDDLKFYRDNAQSELSACNEVNAELASLVRPIPEIHFSKLSARAQEMLHYLFFHGPAPTGPVCYAKDLYGPFIDFDCDGEFDSCSECDERLR